MKSRPLALAHNKAWASISRTGWNVQFTGSPIRTTGLVMVFMVSVFWVQGFFGEATCSALRYPSYRWCPRNRNRAGDGVGARRVDLSTELYNLSGILNSAGNFEFSRIHAPVKLLDEIHEEIFWRSLRTLQSQKLLDLGLGDSSFHDMAAWLAASAAREDSGLLIRKFNSKARRRDLVKRAKSIFGIASAP